VFCNEDGLIATHGIIERRAEDEFCFFAGGPRPMMKLAESSLDVEAEMRNEYLFQIAGPKSLEVLEKATGGAFATSASSGWTGMMGLPGALPVPGRLANQHA
jgi:glycine cleavage system aminomethyltransferase T